MSSRAVKSSEQSTARGPARARLIEAAHGMVRRQGYAATSVDALCAAAGVTKGAFFHHFATKEALAVAAAKAWTERARPLFDAPEVSRIADPLDRVLAHIDLRSRMIDGAVADFTCFVGTMVQENFASSEPIRDACAASIAAYADRLAQDIQAAIELHGVRGVDALGLAWHVQAVLQGAFILAKAENGPARARESIAHLQHYVAMLFARHGEGGT